MMGSDDHRTIIIDGASLGTPADFYNALLPQLGAPDWHGQNLDALWDSITGRLNAVEPPFQVRIVGAAQMTGDMQAFLTRVNRLFEDAMNERGCDVRLELA